MARTDNLREQHKDIVKIVTDISGLLSPEKIKDASEVHKLLLALSGKLKMHLAAEDKVLYPYLLKSKDANVHNVAKQFIDEMGSIGTAFEGYINKWKIKTEIEKNASGFIADTQGLFGVLGARVGKEESVLYPMADKQ